MRCKFPRLPWERNLGGGGEGLKRLLTLWGVIAGGSSKAGGIPNGEPGERSYAKGYYAAFVLDPLGNNIEAVHYNPFWPQVVKNMSNMLAMLLGAIASRAFWGYVRRAGWL